MKHHPTRERVRGKGYFSRLGPGIVTGAADDDPSGIATYSQVGAATGYRLLWGAVFLLPLAFAVQEACARLAIATGKGLAGIIRERLPRPVLYICVILVAIANTVNIAADLASMAAALRLLVPVDQTIGVVAFAVVIALSELYVPYHRYSRMLRWLTLSLFAYVAVMFVAQVDWPAVMERFRRAVLGSQVLAAVAAVWVIGTLNRPPNKPHALHNLANQVKKSG